MDKEIKFEEALAGLEEAVKKLEGGNMTLDESLAIYERAVSLARVCNERLENAEGRVRLLVEGHDASVSDCPFDPNC